MTTIVRICAFLLMVLAIVQYSIGAPIGDWLFSAVMSINLRVGLMSYWMRPDV